MPWPIRAYKHFAANRCPGRTKWIRRGRVVLNGRATDVCHHSSQLITPVLGLASSGEARSAVWPANASTGEDQRAGWILSAHELHEGANLRAGQAPRGMEH